MRIALVSREGAVLEAYRNFFEPQGVDLIHLKSISELFQKLPDTILSGFVVDIQIAIRTTEPEKRWLQTMEGIFPNVRTHWNPETGFRALYGDGSSPETRNLSTFIKDCRKFSPGPCASMCARAFISISCFGRLQNKGRGRNGHTH